ncbi:MAG TPA: Rrf2 family transcriptional regulator [Chloroflexi bacterium]|nr:Rrf2 family transcriptional regulator [Chloroflexota bacterium]
MLRISRRADYAVRVMIAVASEPYGTYTPASQIGEAMLIPQPFLVKVVGDLRRAGLISTAAGRGGGLTLSRPADTINLRHIIESVEGPIILNTCLLRSGECPRDQICPAHPVWRHIQQVLCGEMEAVTLAALVEQGHLLRPSPPPDEDDTQGTG